MVTERMILSGGAEMDAYVPGAAVQGDRDRIGLIICPGGGYARHSTREQERVALRFASLGMSCFVLRYHVSPWRFPTQLMDAAQAVRQVREHAEEYRVHPDRIAVMSFSSGGHVADCLGTMWHWQETMAQAGCTPAQARPNAMVLCYPVVTAGPFAHRGSFVHLTGETDKTQHMALSLETLVTPETPPAFLWHTWPDDDVPVENTLLMAMALHRAGVRAEVQLYGEGPHGLALADATTAAADRPDMNVTAVQGWPEQAARFLRSILIQ